MRDPELAGRAGYVPVCLYIYLDSEYPVAKKQIRRSSIPDAPPLALLDTPLTQPR